MATALDFKMHPELLLSVIKKQAGTIDKAILEGVMNSVDAGSSYVNVVVEPYKVIITDDGKGFVDKQEISDFFATFGTPHEEGDATYGKFRMGRGQMFSFGKNTWRTGEFEMIVDIDDRLGFDLSEGLDHKQGCHIEIELYEPLDETSMHQVTKTLKKMVKYVDIPVTVNGLVVSTTPEESKFTHVTDEAFIKISASSYGSLDIYNLGVFVESIPSYRYGVSGIIVSRQQLDVNFARNQVLAKCKVWKNIKPFVDKKGKEQVSKKQELSDGEQINMAIRLIEGDTIGMEKIATTRFIKDSTGKAWSFSMLKRNGISNYSVAPSYDFTADKIMQNDPEVIIISQEFLDAVGVEYDQFFNLVDNNTWRRTLDTIPTYIPFQTLKDGISFEYKGISKNQYTPTEKAWLEIIYQANHMMFFDLVWTPDQRGYQEKTQNIRNIQLGQSTTAQAWTDGESYITFARDFLERHKPFTNGRPNVDSIMAVLSVMAHEYCHQSDSREDGHTPDFYRAYHDYMVSDKFARTLAKVCKWLTPAKWEKIKKK